MAGGKHMNKEERNEVTVKLPYQIGEVVRTYQNGQRFTDKVRPVSYTHLTLPTT